MNVDTVETALSRIELAADPAALFGCDDHKKSYHHLALIVHPDKVDRKLKGRAEKAFAKLRDMYASVNGAKKPSAGEKLVGNWLVSDPLAKGSLCDIYSATSVKDPTLQAAFKLARSPKDHDLLEQEYVSLGILHASIAKHGHSGFGKYFPCVIDRMEASHRRANILTLSEGMPLSAISSFYPSGLDFRHIVWMANRALSAIGYVHTCGIVHGAVLPEHLLYGPKTHSLMLADWCYSATAESRKHIPAIVTDRRLLYPAEVARKLPAHPATDIYMLFASLLTSGCGIPARFRGLFDWAMAASPKSRPNSAWELQDRFLALAREEYGEPKYLELKIPVT